MAPENRVAGLKFAFLFKVRNRHILGTTADSFRLAGNRTAIRKPRLRDRAGFPPFREAGLYASQTDAYTRLMRCAPCILVGEENQSPWRKGLRTERDKMLAGELYDALDLDLVWDRDRARDLCQALNATRESERETRRQILLQLFGKGGDTVWMQPPFFCDYGSNIELGERVFFNFNCVVLDVCPVKIGDFTLFGPSVQILTPMHSLNAELRRQQEFGKPISIGSDVWVGGGALILPGVRIGSRTVIGAGSIVTRDIPDDVFAAGNPCRVIRDISQENRPAATPASSDH
jgi:maltose O-acetyltransferase